MQIVAWVAAAVVAVGVAARVTTTLRFRARRRDELAQEQAYERSVAELGRMLRSFSNGSELPPELARRALEAYARAAGPSDPPPAELPAGLRAATAMTRALSESSPALLQQILKGSFAFWEDLGVHVTPPHFYEPVPDTRVLRGLPWPDPGRELPGLRMNEKEQLRLLSLFQRRFKREYDAFPRERTSVPHEYFVHNGQFGSVDGELLYCMIRQFKPERIVEVGSGFSTFVAAQAVERNRRHNSGSSCELVAIEPYPRAELKAGFPGLDRLIPLPVEQVPLEEFTALRENDVLFIDSSHVVRPGSDVVYEFLEILPRLAPGVLVHVHDIFLPAEYPRDWVIDQHKFFTEQYLLQAFLAFNDSFEVLLSASMLHLKAPERLKRAFASYGRDRWPASIWLRKTC